MKKFLPFILLLLVVSCGGLSQQAVVRKDSKASAADMVPADTKDSEIPSGKYKDMYSVSNNVFIYLSPDANGSISSNDQLMKYDRVKMYEVRGDWARISLSVTLPERSRRQQGWVVRSAVDEWVTTKFFKVKDNIFKANKSMNLFENPLPIEQNNQTSRVTSEFIMGSIAPNETYRVLKGNGERIFVVTSAGKNGWIDHGVTETKNLVAKGFSYKEKDSFELKPSATLKVGDRPAKYQIMPEDMTDKAMLSGNYDSVPRFFLPYPPYEKLGTHIYQNGKEVNLHEKLGLKGNKTWTEIIGDETYQFDQTLILNLFGMIGVVDIGIPQKYLDAFDAYYKKNFGGRFWLSVEIRWQDYEKFVEYLKSLGKFEEILRINLYTRDVRLQKVKELNIKGTFTAKSSLEFLTNALEYRLSDNGVDFILNVGDNGVVLDKQPRISEPDPRYYEQGTISVLYPAYITRKDLGSRNNYAVKAKKIEFKLPKSDLDKTGISVAELRGKWEQYSLYKEKYWPVNLNYIIKKIKEYLLKNKIAKSENDIGIRKNVFMSEIVFIDPYNISIAYYKNKKMNTGEILFINSNGEVINKNSFNNSLAISQVAVIKDKLLWNYSIGGRAYTEIFTGVENEY